MDSRESSYKFYSMGIVVVNKPEGTDKIEVLPVEEFSFVNGLIKDSKSSLNVNLPDHKGVNRQDKIQGKPTIIANWAPLSDDNRSTAPDVVANETVLILQMADVQEYFWVKLLREPSLRRKETVLYSYSNLPDGIKAYDKDSSYWMLWDTRRQLVQIHTASNDGEPFKFDFIINGKDGSVVIQDDAGNKILMDSKNDLISLNSIAGANIDLDQGHIKMHGKTITMTADDSITMNAPKTTINSTTTNNGDFSVNGLASLNEGTKGTGGAEFGGGNFAVSGGSTSISGGDIKLEGGSITANGEDLTEDKT